MTAAMDGATIAQPLCPPWPVTGPRAWGDGLRLAVAVMVTAMSGIGLTGGRPPCA